MIIPIKRKGFVNQGSNLGCWVLGYQVLSVSLQKVQGAVINSLWEHAFRVCSFLCKRSGFQDPTMPG